MSRSLVVAVALLVLIAVVAFVSVREPAPPPLSVEAFLERHWAEPIPPQGAAPEAFSALEASLDPQDCAHCHQSQFEDWRQSKHAHTMGSGITWQLPILGQAKGNRCLRCHAPLAEQKALTAQRLEWESAPASPPPSYVPGDLDQQGLVCAACHVRAHERFGPPARPEADVDTPVHGGFSAHRAFEDSRFCAHCHQFPADGPRVNGKLQEDTYEQWRRSPAAARGEQCQSCHMPERRHQWRGIHDPAMVRKALELNAELTARADGGRNLSLLLKNVGAGHHLPTYMVPKLIVAVSAESDGGRLQPVGSEVLGWYVETDLKTERFDTRIPAGQSHRLEFPLPADVLDSAQALRIAVDVRPREHYERMFEQVLADPNLSDQSSALVRVALEEARQSHYRLLERRVPLNTTPP